VLEEVCSLELLVVGAGAALGVTTVVAAGGVCWQPANIRPMIAGPNTGTYFLMKRIVIEILLQESR
jgi:hypothetical protein